ncbi:TniQ family protein [Antarcticirhabdus aurantiaca]|uniref:TniQ family protein n=1 Tax=Antarcticirhabdus aurantiaca TaxID=2606717 RepID=UPI00131E33C3|nr:TniQ family protein [Antarcticirhabdus aurantiaca]
MMERTNWLPPVWVRPEPDEPLHGVMLRLCETNGLPQMSHLELAAGISLARVRGGEQADAVARMLRCESASLEPHLWRRPTPNYRSWNGVLVSVVRDADFVHRRVCPGCLNEKAYHRFHWDVSAVSSCLAHDRLLVGSCSCGKALSWRDGALGKCRHCESGSVHDVPPSAPHPNAAAFDAYLLGRLGAAPKVPNAVFDPLSIRDACDVAGRIGVLDILGYRPRWTEVRDADMPVAVVRGRGYAILTQDRLGETLERVWTEFQEKHRPKRSAEGDRPRIDHAYGWVVPWFRHHGGEVLVPQIAAAIVRHASSKFMLTAGTFPSVERSGETLNLSQARAVCGTSARTLRRLLIMEGFLPTQLKKGSPLRIERTVVDRVAADFAQALTQADLVATTGLSIWAVENLCKADAIPCWLKGGGVAFHQYRFRRSDVELWMRELLEGAPKVGTRPVGAVALCDYAAELGIPTTETIALLRRGELQLVSTAGEDRTFADTFVASMPSEAADIVSATTVSMTLGLAKPIVEELAEAGLIQRRQAPLHHRRETRNFFSRRSMDDLQRAVTAAAEPWEAGSDHRKRSKIRLTKAVRRYEDKVSWVAVLSAIKEGRLKAFVDPECSPTMAASLFLDDASNLQALASDAGEKGVARKLNIAEAAVYLGTNTGAVSAFRKAGLLGKADEHLGVDLDELQAFRDRYILSGEIVERTGTSWFTLTSTLASAGIHPAREWISGLKVSRRIYDRAAVEGFIQIPANAPGLQSSHRG